ncbi:MAG: thermonuclease family protein [Candidatus Thiodiazotropha sp.]
MERNYQRSIIDRLGHKRIVFFWAVALTFLPLPWLVDGGPLDKHTVSQSIEGCSVLSVYDGDTMTVRCNGDKVKLRLYCIDAPEIGQSPWGVRSRDSLRRMSGDRVDVVLYYRDRYKRMVSEIHSGRKNLNLSLVENGEAAVYPRYCDDAVYDRAEERARSRKLGIWSDAGLHQTPWRWRAIH